MRVLSPDVEGSTLPSVPLEDEVRGHRSPLCMGNQEGKNMRALVDDYKVAMVTGGAGFIGSHLVDALLDRGVEVVCVDNYLSGNIKNIEGHLADLTLHERNVDICDYEKLEELFKHKWMNGDGIDIIFHEAASKKTICLADPRRDLRINGEGTFNLLELARKYDVKKFVHASTGSVYGGAMVFPQTEEHPLLPASYYGVSKLAGEKYVKVFNHLYGMDTTVLRYFHVYGPRQNYSDYGGVVSIFIRNILKGQPIRIHGDGSQKRCWTFVDDDVRANLMVATNNSTVGHAYNCATEVNHTVKELAETLKKLTRSQVPVLYDDWAVGDIKDFAVSNMKLKSLGFEFKTSFEDGLRATLQWMRDNLALYEGNA